MNLNFLKLFQLALTIIAFLTYPSAQAQRQNELHPLSTVVWPLEMINADKAHKLPNGQGEGIQICMIDSGIDIKNPYLKDAILGGRSFTNEKDPDNFADDGVYTFGTWIATLLVGQSPENAHHKFSGVAPKAKIWIAKVYDSRSQTEILSVAKALLYCSERSSIINISLSAYMESPALHGIIEELRKKGITIIAGGNTINPGDPKMGLSYPAADPFVYAVGAVNEHSEISKISPKDSRLDMVAPGESIPIPQADGKIINFNGTGFASAFVTGVEAIRQARKAKTLKFRDLGQTTEQQGQGLIDAYLTATDL
jgi:subtilisin family serine protease